MTGPQTTPPSNTVRNTGLTLAAFLVLATSWWYASHRTPEPAKATASINLDSVRAVAAVSDSSRIKVDTTKIHLGCIDPKARHDGVNCVIVLPDAKGTIKKHMTPSDTMVQAYYNREYDSVQVRIRKAMHEGTSVQMHTPTGTKTMTRYQARVYLDSLRAAKQPPPVVEFPN
jgi:hypothetical protein